MKRLVHLGLVLLAVLIVSAATVARADFATGLRSYEAGDYYTAYKEWLPLAESGDPAAQRNLGHLYRLGRGVTKDFVKAAAWYRKSAEQGFARAQANLGNMYLRGQGVPKDPITAAKWFGRAAKQEHPIAQFNLGLMYENGIGLAQDDVAALVWYYRASKSGHRKAAQRLARLVSRGATPPTDDALPPTEPDKGDRLASAQRGKPAQPLYAESGSRLADTDRANSEDADSDKAAKKTSATDSPDQSAPPAPHPTIVAEAKEDAARAKAHTSDGDIQPSSPAQEADRGDKPAVSPVEPVIAPVQAKDETESAKPIPPHPIIIAEAAATTQEGKVAPAQGGEAEGADKETAGMRAVAKPEDSVTPDGEAAESETANSEAIPPPAFLVREAEQQQKSKETTVAVENGDASSSSPARPESQTAALREEKTGRKERTEPTEAQASAEPAAAPANVPEPDSKKSTVRQKAIELAALRQAARRTARFERRLQSQLPGWASEFKNVPMPGDADTSIEKSIVSGTPEPASSATNVTAESSIETNSDSGLTDDSTRDRESTVAASSEPATTSAIPSPQQSTVTQEEKGSSARPVEIAAGNASDDPSPSKSPETVTSSTSAGNADTGFQAEADSTRSNRSQADSAQGDNTQAESTQASSTLSSALASAVADLAETESDKGGAAAEAVTKDAEEDASSSNAPPTDQVTPAPDGPPSTSDQNAATASTEASPSPAPAPETVESAEVPIPATVLASKPAEAGIEAVGEAVAESEGAAAASQPQKESATTLTDAPEMPTESASGDPADASESADAGRFANVGQSESTTVEAGVDPVGAPQRMASLADEQTRTPAATKGDIQKSSPEPIPTIPDDTVKPEMPGKPEMLGKQEMPASGRASEEEAPEASLLPDIAPMLQTDEARVEPSPAEVDKPAAPPAPDESAITENAAAPQPDTKEIASEADENLQSPEDGGDSQAVEQPEIPSSSNAVREAEPVSDSDPVSETKPISNPDTPVQVAAVSAAVAEPPEPKTTVPTNREEVAPAKALDISGTNTQTESPPGKSSHPDPDPTPVQPQDVAVVPATTPMQSTDGLLEKERRDMERKRIVEQRQTAREEQARRRIRELFKIQESWELAALRRDQATGAQIIREGGVKLGRIPVEKPKSDDSSNPPQQKPPTQNMASTPATAPDSESNSATDQRATEVSNIEPEASSPATPAPLGVALDGGLSAYQAHDYEAAFRHWLPPAENGDSNAQFFVGGLYRDGAGVPEDSIRAFHWWTLAAEQGHQQADKLLAELKSEMLPDEIAAAKKLSE